MRKELPPPSAQEKPRDIAATQPSAVPTPPPRIESFGYLYWLGSLGFGEKSQR